MILSVLNPGRCPRINLLLHLLYPTRNKIKNLVYEGGAIHKASPKGRDQRDEADIFRKESSIMSGHQREQRGEPRTIGRDSKGNSV